MSNIPPETASIPFHFIMPVWGKLYTRLFVDIALPNQLGAGNLPAFANDRLAKYKIYTTHHDAKLIRSSKVFLRLQSLMPVSINIIDNLEAQSPDQNLSENKTAVNAMTRCHKVAIDDGVKEDAALVFLHPDMVWSSGSFDQLRARAYEGKRVVAIAQLRVDEETFLPMYRSQFVSEDGIVSAPARDLTRLALTHLHPTLKAGFIGSGFEPLWYLIWSAGESGFVYRSLTMHPLLIRPMVKKVDYKISFDEDYCYLAVPNYDNYHVVTDSDEIVAYEFSPKGKLADMLSPGSFDPLAFAEGVVQTTNSIRRKFLLNKIRIHSDTISGDWLYAEHVSDEAVNKAIAACAISEDDLNPDSSILQPSVSFERVKKVVIFGAGSGGDLAYELTKAKGWQTQFFVDSNVNLIGKRILGFEIEGPERLAARDFDLIIVASEPGCETIFRKLDKMGFSMSAGDYIFFRDPVFNG